MNKIKTDNWRLFISFGIDLILLITLYTKLETYLHDFSGWLETFIMSIIGYAYALLTFILFNRTIGGLMLGIKIVTEDDRKPTLKQLFIRATFSPCKLYFNNMFGDMEIIRDYSDKKSETYLVTIRTNKQKSN